MTSPRVVPRVDWPVLELLLEPGTGDELATLVRALAEVCRPTAPDHTVFGAARLLSSPFAPESYLVQRDPDVPYAVVVRRPDELSHPVTEGARCVVTLGADVAGLAGHRGLALSPHAVRSREVLPVPSSVRAALRRRHRLPEPFVVRVGRPGAVPLGADSLATALRLATVADIVGPAAIDALALGTAVVTDAATAELLGAEHGVHVLVADAAVSATAAGELAADELRAAALGRAGRRLVETVHDADRTARALIDRLGLVPPSRTPAAPGLRLGELLGELGTPSGHPVELQLADRLAGLGVAPRTAGSIR